MSAAQTENELTARDKGDIYWRKLKYYLKSAGEKGRSADDGRNGKTLAMELLELAEEPYENRPEITGNEFKLRPPTAAGTQAYKDSILQVMRSADYYRSLLENGKLPIEDTSDSAARRYIEKMLPLMERVLDIWFLANGVDRKKKKQADGKKVADAKKKLPASILAYEETVKGFRHFVSMMIVERLKPELPAENMPVAEREEEFTALIEANPESYRLIRSKIDQALTELLYLRKKRERLERELSSLYALATTKNEDKTGQGFMTLSEALALYRDHTDEQIAAIIWAEEGCTAFVKGVLNGEICDPMIADYIRSRFGAPVPTYPLFERVNTLPGFCSLAAFSDAEEKITYKNVKEIREGIHELKVYRDAHKRQFQYQSICTMLFHTEELPQIAGKARTLRNRLARGFRDGEFDGLSKREQAEFEDFFVTADAMAKVSYLVIEYSLASENKTLIELIGSFDTDTGEMDYHVQETRIRTYIRQYISEKTCTRTN